MALLVWACNMNERQEVTSKGIILPYGWNMGVEEDKERDRKRETRS